MECMKIRVIVYISIGDLICQKFTKKTHGEKRNGNNQNDSMYAHQKYGNTIYTFLKRTFSLKLTLSHFCDGIFFMKIYIFVHRISRT